MIIVLLLLDTQLLKEFLQLRVSLHALVAAISSISVLKMVIQFCNLFCHNTAPLIKIIKYPDVDILLSRSPTISASVYPLLKHKHNFESSLEIPKDLFDSIAMLFTRIGNILADDSCYMSNIWSNINYSIHQTTNNQLKRNLCHVFFVFLTCKTLLDTQFELTHKWSNFLNFAHVKPVNHLLNVIFLRQPKFLILLVPKDFHPKNLSIQTQILHCLEFI